MEQLESELKTLIVESLMLEGVKPSDIGSDEQLFGDDGLALDSIDALEIGVEIQKRYGVKINPADDKIAEHFRTIKSLATFVSSLR